MDFFVVTRNLELAADAEERSATAAAAAKYFSTHHLWWLSEWHSKVRVAHCDNTSWGAAVRLSGLEKAAHLNNQRGILYGVGRGFAV